MSSTTNNTDTKENLPPQSITLPQPMEVELSQEEDKTDEESETHKAYLGKLLNP